MSFELSFSSSRITLTCSINNSLRLSLSLKLSTRFKKAVFTPSLFELGLVSALAVLLQELHL
ncbi:MAG TPA: hypothetical protein DC020_02480 [Flavobacterium sp.]|nr:MAG: hypothetical protein A2X07_06405 [Flavobacteria bacterium GWF1_32_7]HBD25680.1 hypothetical protein [Flavobacterium sp.]